MHIRNWIKILVISACGLAARPAAAEGAPATAPATAPAPADAGKGAFQGVVLDAADGKPVADATVAVQDSAGKVVAWTKTDAQGRYTIPADTLKLLQLRPSKHRGLLSGLVHGAGNVASAAARAAANTVKQVDLVNAAKSGVVAAATGNPAPLVAHAAGAVAGDAKSKLSSTDSAAKAAAVKSVVGERQSPAKATGPVPGEVLLAVSAPGHKAFNGKAGAYWLEPSATEADKPVGPRAWVEHVKLAPEAGDKKSEVEHVAVLLAEPHLDPVLVPRGTSVNISVKLQVPPGLTPKVRVFAREAKKHTVAELKAQPDNTFAGELPIDPVTPAGDSTITVAALRTEPVEVNLKPSKADPLLHFAARVDDLDPGKPYDYDPRIMASENRLDLAVTILDPKQAAPPAAGAPADGTAAPAPKAAG